MNTFSILLLCYILLNKKQLQHSHKMLITLTPKTPN